MIQKIEFNIDELNSMKKYPKELFYKGNLELLKKPKISIIGTRRPLTYTKQLTAKIAAGLSNRGICIVSGAAMGIDSIAHQNAGSQNTIAVMANGLDIKYPSVNKSIIEKIEQEGLTLSQFESGFKATPWSFVVRNEVVVSLGDKLIVSEADLKSGSMRSVEFALKMNKEIFVLPHRLGESEGTNYLLKNSLATAIYDIDEFLCGFGTKTDICNDDFLEYCRKKPTLNEALLKFGNIVYEYELEGKIAIENNFIIVLF
ncbi:DNA-processing protein DprA [Sulfurospirillum arcachonense]|uniref:DNA-processing protein DprA n=1 Tax=Sulfurospirillum arcachonense TaxID=57666 RepID=UPI000467F79F|nr:DNA-processing protein DprA [Sulfurospirillum arcachonense]